MTPKQDSFIRTLVGERVATLRAMADAGDAKARFLVRWNAGEIRSATLDVSKASSAIEWLLTIARDGGETPAAATPDVPAGRYALVGDDGVVKFYVIDRPTEGKWAGRTFVSAQASDEKFPIRNRESRNAILAAIAADPHGAMIRYGHELGRCGNCGRTLTDETSREMGIGPECAKALGIDRTPYSERARRDAAARATGEAREEEAPAPADEIDLSTAAYAPESADPTGNPSETLDGPQNAVHGATRRDPSASMTWRARKAAVAEQQADAGPTKREYPGMRRAAAGVAAGMEAPFTVVSNGGATETFADGADAYLAARSKWSANPLGGRVFVYDNRGETVADFDF